MKILSSCKHRPPNKNANISLNHINLQFSFIAMPSRHKKLRNNFVKNLNFQLKSPLSPSPHLNSFFMSLVHHDTQEFYFIEKLHAPLSVLCRINDRKIFSCFLCLIASSLLQIPSHLMDYMMLHAAKEIGKILKKSKKSFAATVIPNTTHSTTDTEWTLNVCMPNFNTQEWQTWTIY